VLNTITLISVATASCGYRGVLAATGDRGHELG